MLAMLNCQLKSPIVGLGSSHYVDSTIQLVGRPEISMWKFGLAVCRNSGLSLGNSGLSLRGCIYWSCAVNSHSGWQSLWTFWT